MSAGRRLVVEWPAPEAKGGALRLVEPTPAEVRAHAAALAGFYNDPHNSALMTNEHEFSPEDVEEHFDALVAEGGRTFLLFAGETLMGDCDLRHIAGGAAEYAVMVGARATQAKGFGTRFTLMALAVAFGELGLARVYAAVRPENAGSLRMFEKLGFARDESAEASAFKEEADDVCLSLGADAFRMAHAREVAAMRTAEREERLLP